VGNTDEEAAPWRSFCTMAMQLVAYNIPVMANRQQGYQIWYGIRQHGQYPAYLHHPPYLTRQRTMVVAAGACSWPPRMKRKTPHFNNGKAQ